ncbi:MAG: hypothetical protein ACKOS8_17405, partial [Gemmataceae bacterium]
KVLSAASDILQQVDAATGKEIWRFPYSGYSVVPRPYQVSGDLAVLSTGVRQAQAVVHPFGRPKGRTGSTGLVDREKRSTHPHPADGGRQAAGAG